MKIKTLKEILNKYDDDLEILIAWQYDDSDGAEGYSDIDEPAVEDVKKLIHLTFDKKNKFTTYKLLNSDNKCFGEKAESVEKIKALIIT